MIGHLQKEGYEKVGFFSQLPMHHVKKRYLAFKTSLENNNLSLKQEWILGFDIEKDDFLFPDNVQKGVCYQ